MSSSAGKALRAALALLGAGVLGASSCDGDVGEGDQPGIYTVRVSVDRDGRQGLGGSAGSAYPSLSDDGQIAAFESDVDTLTTEDVFTGKDVLAKNRRTGEVRLVSRRDAGYNPGLNAVLGPSHSPSMSSNGRFVAFASVGDLASGFSLTSGNETLYVADLATGEVRRVTQVDPNAALAKPSISRDGRWVAFQTLATNLPLSGPHTLPAVSQIYVADMNLGTPAITLISRTDGSPVTGLSGPSLNPRISDDGTAVVFHAFANASTGGASVISQVYAADFNGVSWSTCQLVSRATGGAGIAGDEDSFDAAVSADGSVVVFASKSSILVPGTGDVNPGIAMRDRATTTTSVVGLDAAGATVYNSSSPRVSGDGRRIAWLGPVPGSGLQVYARNLDAGVTSIASVNVRGIPADRFCLQPSLSLDGRVVAWDSDALNLVLDDTNGLSDVFLRDPLP